ncbi:MAG: carboxylating nicotinate-nucleotide diphosphorylase [Patescibacteria group bacterium]|jgi:nicotinate-nucleotide pyrophosphorylase (carboxylating)
MNHYQRLQKLKTIYDHSNELTPTKPWYRAQLKHFLLDTINIDAASDITTKHFSQRNNIVEAVLVSQAKGVLAGSAELAWLAKQFNVEVKVLCKDGTRLKPGKIIARLRGKAKTLLASERTLVNTVQRMSGIATHTAQIVQYVSKSSSKTPFICATRKTLLGALDKKAVVVGGGYTHRLGLFDGVLVKDNHLALLSNLKQLKGIYYSSKYSRIIEVKTVQQLKTIITLILDYDVILFDNFSPERIKFALKWLKKNGLDKPYLFEASGGITAQNVKQYIATGVDAISLGSLTHSAASLNLSLELYRDDRAK